MKVVMQLVRAVFNQVKKRWSSLGLVAKGLLVLMLVGGIWFGYTKFSAKAETTYQFATVQRGSLVQKTEETGEIVATNKTAVTSSVTGIVTEVYVVNGAAVKRGDKLFYVKSTATEAERSQKLAAYKSAQAAVEQANASQYSAQSKMFTDWDEYIQKTNRDEYKETDATARVLPGFQSTQKDWLAAEAEYKAQADVVAKAKATLNQTWLEYQATVDAPVKATADGVVANISIASGQTVSAADTALIIKTNSQTWVKVGLSESDIIQVQPGHKAIVTVDALKGKEYPAVVQRVDEFGTNVSDVIVYYVYLTLDQADEQVRPAMTVQAAITTQEKNEVVLVPATALKPYQGAKAVQVLDTATQTAIYKPVTVGISDDVMVEVLSGLTEGEQIIVSSNSTSDASNRSGGGFFRGPN